MISIKSLLRNLIVQKTINVLFRYPRSFHKKVTTFGGYIDYLVMYQNKKMMINASSKLKPIKSYDDGLNVFFLTGKKYLYQTLFCISSLAKCSNEKFKFNLIDDSSFDDELIGLVSKLLPNAKIYLNEEMEQNIKKKVFGNNLEIILKKRKEYIHIRKLIDVHTLPDLDWKLIIDSDMLFWSEPKEMINWLKNPNSPIYMIDSEESYGYSSLLMEQLVRNKIPKLLNVGIFGFKSEMINWNEIVEWIKTLEEREGKSYFLEQAISAMMVGNKQCTILNPQQYIVNPSKHHVISRKGVLHHYVDFSKKTYFNDAWKSLM